MRIMYIEDDNTNLALVERIAHSGNHEVINYPMAEEALQKFQEKVPDLVLMDLMLAGEMDGLTMVRYLREGGFEGPIVAVSAFLSEEECLNAGCDYYFEKPVAVNDMLQLIEHFAQQLG